MGKTKKSAGTSNKTQSKKKDNLSKRKKKGSNRKVTHGEVLKELMEYLQKIEDESLVKIGYIVFSIYMCILAFRYIYAIVWLEKKVITSNIIIALICAAIPFGLWIYSTKFDRWNYHNIKMRWLYLVVINAIATMEQLVIPITWQVLVVRILRIEITENMTKNMVVTLGRICMIVPLILVTALIATPIFQFLKTNEVQEKIKSFKILHHVDLRKNKSHLYDLNIIKDLETGKTTPILEDDRFVHMFINGQSGTGKTSSTIIPAVAEDLDKKVDNMREREKLLLQMVKAKKAYVAGPYNYVDDTNVRPRKGHEEEYKKIWETYPDCGITVMAPNNDMNNTIVKLCQARKIPVNVIDPAKRYTESYAKAKGIQNFYIPLDLSEEERSIRILAQAQTFSEVMIAANEAAGPGEQYFRDINTSVTTNIAIVCMLSANIKGQQSDITEVQRCIDKFDELQPMVEEIEEYYGINVVVTDIKVNNNDATRETLNKNKAVIGRGAGKDNPYYSTILFVKNELLGKGQEKMYDQARGLRNLIDKIILDPRYRKILSAPIEQSLDFDEALARNQVTVVNTALEFGSQVSTALGLIFLLNLQTAVLRRPPETRSNHFIWVDEASQYMHKVYDNMYALYRQYRVATALAMQTISQMDKNKSTEYLKNIILGAGTQIVFGRVSAEEMKLYQDIAGVVLTDTVQKTVSQTSIFTSSASQSASDRIIQEQKNNLEGTSIRVRDFQEVSVFKIKQGRVIKGFLGKTNFLDKKKLEDQHVLRVNFKKYAPVKKEVKLTPKAENYVKEQQLLLQDVTEETRILTADMDKPMYKTPVEKTIELHSKEVKEENIGTEVEKKEEERKSPMETLFGNLFADDEIEDEVESYKDELEDEDLE